MTDLIITKLERHEGPRPYWTARVHSNGEHVDVNNRYGSWQVTDEWREARRGLGRDVLPEVAAALQAKLPRTERGRR